MVIMQNDELTITLKNIMKEIDEGLDRYQYDYESKIDLIYDFLTTCENHFLDPFIKENENLDNKKFLFYKGMLILILCTDFYVDINYRINNKKICVDYQEEIFKQLSLNKTYKKLLFFFKNPFNEDYIKTIINHFYIYNEKDHLYKNRCLDNVIDTHKTFVVLSMNPLFVINNNGYGEIIRPEIIKSDVFEIYDDLDLEQIQNSIFSDFEYEIIEYLRVISPSNKKNTKISSFIDLEESEELDPLFIELKKKMLELFKKKYNTKMEFNKAIAYVIINAYESMKLNNNKEYESIIGYLENNHSNISKIVNMFINDDGFSNCILFEFINNNKLIKENEIINRRQELERLGYVKVLKKYNSFYDIENKKYGGSKNEKSL